MFEIDGCEEVKSSILWAQRREKRDRNERLVYVSLSPKCTYFCTPQIQVLLPIQVRIAVVMVVVVLIVAEPVVVSNSMS